jgi:hypothetical protein
VAISAKPHQIVNRVVRSAMIHVVDHQNFFVFNAALGANRQNFIFRHNAVISMFTASPIGMLWSDKNGITPFGLT